MSKSNPLSVRLDDDQVAKIKEIAKRFKVGEADVIRWGVDALVAYVERHNGRLHLPIDFGEIWQQVSASAPVAARDDLAIIAEEPAAYSTGKRKAS